MGINPLVDARIGDFTPIKNLPTIRAFIETYSGLDLQSGIDPVDIRQFFALQSGFGVVRVRRQAL